MQRYFIKEELKYKMHKIIGMTMCILSLSKLLLKKLYSLYLATLLLCWLLKHCRHAPSFSTSFSNSSILLKKVPWHFYLKLEIFMCTIPNFTLYLSFFFITWLQFQFIWMFFYFPPSFMCVLCSM